MWCPGAPRRSGRTPVTIKKKSFKNVVKQSDSGKSRYAANPLGPNGGTSARRGSQSPATAHVENPWGNKGNLDPLEVRLCFVRDGIRGGRCPVTIKKKSIKNVVKQNDSGKSRYAANPLGPNGPPSALRFPVIINQKLFRKRCKTKHF